MSISSRCLASDVWIHCDSWGVCVCVCVCVHWCANPWDLSAGAVDWKQAAGVRLWFVLILRWADVVLLKPHQIHKLLLCIILIIHLITYRTPAWNQAAGRTALLRRILKCYCSCVRWRGSALPKRNNIIYQQVLHFTIVCISRSYKVHAGLVIGGWMWKTTDHAAFHLVFCYLIQVDFSAFTDIICFKKIEKKFLSNQIYCRFLWGSTNI